MTIQRTAVESSLLTSHGWEPNEGDDTGTLAVEFPARGNTPASVYHYSQVPKTVWESFQAAESKGKFFLKNIKGNASFPHSKQEAAAPKES